MYENGLFIFRRDLRIIDNNGLNLLSTYCKNIFTIFIFSPEQVGPSNKYKSNNAVQFMIESLEDLAKDISKKGGKLLTFYGENDTIIQECIKKFDIHIIAFNMDITPYARIRDDNIRKLCVKLNVDLLTEYDYFLTEPDKILNGTGDPYKKFTPYYETASKIKVKPPAILKKLHLATTDKQILNKILLNNAKNNFTTDNPDVLVHGGRENALKQLKIAQTDVQHYSKTRDELAKPTSHLSAYIKFGCISIREVYHKFKTNKPFIRQLYWRDFYGQVLYHFPHVLGHALIPKYDDIKWVHNERLFVAWTKGKTGFPLVDASQRQLLKEGWVHNRGRMLSSSILAKILMIDWRK